MPLFDRVCRESYNQPLEVYEMLKRRGMDLVTVTDHDSIDAGDALLPYPDFFLSEEVSCVTPAGTRIHIGVYDIKERHHFEIQLRKNDLLSLLHYLNEQRLFFTINHAFSSLTGRRVEDDFRIFALHFPGAETRNGQMLPQANSLARAFARRFNQAEIGGSDAHTMSSLGRTFTEVPGVRSKRDFIDRLRIGQGRVRGESGSYFKLTRAVLEIGLHLATDRPWMFPFLALVPLVPAVTALNCMFEAAFARKWAFVAGPFAVEPLNQPAVADAR